MASERYLMDHFPQRKVGWREDPEGKVVLLRPRLGSSRLGQWAAKRIFQDPNYQIRLDEIGTLVWKAADGETRLGEIAESLDDRFGDRVQSAEASLRRFIYQMIRAHLLALYEKPTGKPEV